MNRFEMAWLTQNPGLIGGGIALLFVFGVVFLISLIVDFPGIANLVFFIMRENRRL
jgi:hypothetical protein